MKEKLEKEKEEREQQKRIDDIKREAEEESNKQQKNSILLQLNAIHMKQNYSVIIAETLIYICLAIVISQSRVQQDHQSF
ncbi:hypothetical protein ACLB1Q_06505 [Escherichia coli]